jgi:hypothetical protein
MKKLNSLLKLILIPLITILLIGNLYAGNDKNSKGKSPYVPTQKYGDAYRMYINNLDVPMNRQGVLGDVSVGGYSLGYLGGQTGFPFLFSGGFFMSGKTNGVMWANAVASASRIQDYSPGNALGPVTNSKAVLYCVRQTDGDFATSWEEWKDAVSLGAYFYDGNGDGVYNPVDLNGNGKWDKTEDKPDLIGDETVWCVYNDNIDPALRRFNDVPPQGIDVRQTVFAFNSKGVVGNMLFIRYSLLNTGKVADVLDSVYFGVWADADLGDANDDLVGCDTTLNSGYVYNDGDDPNHPNVPPPCFLIDFFQGPIAFIPGETFTDANSNGKYDVGEPVLDTAYNVQGQVRGLGVIPGAKNLGLSSIVHYMQSHARLGDPNDRYEARNYTLGQDKIGGNLDPCTWAYGVVNVLPCATINPKWWYSGDPVANVGWINNTPIDQRLMCNTGPFKLEKNKPVDIVVAYVVAQGENAKNSINKTKLYDKTAQIVFDANFPSPPPPPPVAIETQTGDGFISLQWNTDKQVSYHAIDTVLDIDRRFQGYYITGFRTNSKQEMVSGLINSKELISYDLKDSINNIWAKYPHGGVLKIRDEAAPENKLDSLLYSNPNTGRIRFTIDKDPFTDEPLIKGKEYYFAVTTYTLNHKNIRLKSNDTLYGPAGDYVDLSSGGAFEEYETQIVRVVYGDNLFSPQVLGDKGNLSAGYADGSVTYLVVNKEQLTGDKYRVEFLQDTTTGIAYKPFWKLINETKNTVLVDSSKNYDYDTTKYAGKVIDGIIVKVKPIDPTFGTATYSATTKWYDNFSAANGCGVFYVGSDIPQGSGLPKFDRFNGVRSKIITGDRLRKVELRFGTSGKAYRYINGYKGTFITRKTTFVYGEAVVAADTNGRGMVGKLGEGFVDVPFTAWVVDDKTKESKQLAVGFIETSGDQGGTPDGIWNPGDSVMLSYEVIAIFDAPYDPNGNQIEYTGKYAGSTVFADIIKGYSISDTTVSLKQRKIAASPWFNTLYVVSLSRQGTAFYSANEKLTIPVSVYPYTNTTQYSFSTKKGGTLSEADRKELFNKVNVFPNPLFAYNPASSFNNSNTDEPFVTFSNLPTEVTIKIFTLSGVNVRTLTTADKSSATSPFIRWDLENQEGLRVASGMYLAIVSAPGYGEKILKFAIIMPQKQIQRY